MVILSWVLGVVSVLGVSGAVAAFIFFPAVAAPIIEGAIKAIFGCKPCLVVAVLIVVALGSFWYGRKGQYDAGHAAAIAEIAAENEATIARALEKRGEWRKCRDGGGAWDQTAGSCK